MRRLILVFLLVLATTPAWATTRYMATTGSDANSCAASATITTPKLTYASAYACMAAGDILYIRTGTYVMRIDGQLPPNGTSWSDAPVVAGYPGETVMFRPGSGTPIVHLPLDTIHYLIFQNLILDGTGMTNGSSSGGAAEGVSFGSNGNTIHHIRFDHVIIQNIPGNGVAGRGFNMQFWYVTLHHTGQGSEAAGYGSGSSGIYWSTGDFNVFDHMLAYDNACDAIRTWGSGAGAVGSALTSNHNTISNSNFHDNGRGYATGGSSACLAGGGGLELGDDDNTSVNNIFNRNYKAIHLNRQSGRGSNNLKVYNNTITNSVVGIQAEFANVNTPQIANNHVVGNTTNISVDIATGEVLTTNRTTGAITDCTVSATNFHQKIGSLCVDAGTTLASVTTDITGLPRPQGARSDIGAYEFDVSDATPPAVPTGLNVQ